MIIARNLLKSIIKIPHRKLLTINYHSFAQLDSNIASIEAFNKFSAYMNDSSTQSLTSAAEMMAQLEVQVQQYEQTIQQLQRELQKCPSQTKLLIQKIQKVIDNIDLQNQEIIGITKRAQKQINDCRNFAITNAAKQVLDVADSLKKCYEHAQQVYKNDNHQNVVLIKEAFTQIHRIFQVHGILQFDPIDSVYDPNKQQALVHVPLQQGKKSNTVAFTSRTGYTIKGRLLRSAHVGVYE